MEEIGLKSWLNRHVHELKASRFAGRVRLDSRAVQPGDIFAAIRGVALDGHQFIGQAVERGASVIIAEEEVALPGSVELIRVVNSAVAAGELAQASYNTPRDRLICLGVTGTNGKTTVAYLVRAILNHAGIGCGLMGTVEYDLGDRVLSADNTTPDCVRLAGMMNQMVQAGCRAMVMECSSHGLDQHRTAGIAFKAAAFTNLTGDHFDYHKTQDHYLNAKSLLFRGLSADATAVLNADDPASQAIGELTQARRCWFGVESQADLCATINASDLSGSSFILSVNGRTFPTRTMMPGRHNISNCLAAAGLAMAAGLEPEVIAEAIRCFSGVPGRLEPVANDRHLTVLVDYAHTDDALERVLVALKHLNPHRLILVFGCGGQRDRSKRPRMAKTAQRWADMIFVTNDNPRNESPDQIFADIQAGFDSSLATAIEEIRDRRSAITAAVGLAEPGDVVLIAGKGHEDYQLIGGHRLEFDDRRVAREAMQHLNGQRKPVTVHSGNYQREPSSGRSCQP